MTEAVIEKADRLEAKPEMEPTQDPILQTRNEPDDYTPGCNPIVFSLRTSYIDCNAFY